MVWPDRFCRFCQASHGEPCVTKKGKVAARMHKARRVPLTRRHGDIAVETNVIKTFDSTKNVWIPVNAGNYIASNTITWQNWNGVKLGGNVVYTGNVNATVTASTYAPRQDAVWQRWNGTGYTTYTDAEYVQARYDQNRRLLAQATLPEQQAARDRQQAEREQRSRERLAQQQRMEGAQERALELLEMILTPEEKIWRANNGGDIMVRAESGRMYVIQTGSYHGVHGNVFETDEHGCRLGRVCVAPKMYDSRDGTLPLADGWVGQYLYIKHQEELFRTVGNWSYRNECQHKDVPLLGQRGSSIAA